MAKDYGPTVKGVAVQGADVPATGASRGARMHYGDSPDDQRRLTRTPRTYCGRPLDEVTYWATPEVARHLTFAPRCGTCQRSLLRRTAP